MGLFKVNEEKSSQKDFNDLLRILKYGKDPLAQKIAAEAIGKTKDDRAVKTLLGVLKDDENKRKHPCVIKEVIEALVRIGEPSVKPLIQAMRGKPVRAYCSSLWFHDCDEWRTIASVITSMLIKIGKPSIKYLIQTLKGTNNNNLREWAIQVLEMMRDKRAIESLIQTLKDGNKKVQNAVEGHLWVMDKKAVKPLIRALQDKNAIVRSKAAKVLGLIKDKRTVKPLIHALEDKSPDVRKSAAWALGVIRDRSAKGFLNRAYKEDYNHSVRKEAKKALGEIERKKKTSYL